MRRFLRRYGSDPLHLLAMATSFALAGYAGLRLFDGQTLAVVVWFVGAAVGHDLVLFPLYAIADRTAIVISRRSARAPALPAAPAVNYVRVPAMLSLLLLLVYLPSILRFVEGYDATTALSSEPYLEHWLLVTGMLFGISGVLYAVRLRRLHTLRRAAPAAPGRRRTTPRRR